MDRELKFKKDYYVAIKDLSDKEAGRFIKNLGSYYFEDKNLTSKNGLVNTYFTLIRRNLDSEKLEDNEKIIEEELSLNKARVTPLENLRINARGLEDLVDYEVAKVFKQGANNGDKDR